VLAGKILLGFCATVMALGSLIAEFSSSHVFNRRWDAHARFHCAVYGLTNALIGAVCVVLLTIDVSQSTVGLWTAIVLMVSADAIMLFAQFVPGVNIVADGEKVVRGFPISYWMTGAHLAIVVLGGVLCVAALPASGLSFALESP